jgi:hypothetical protein
MLEPRSGRCILIEEHISQELHIPFNKNIYFIANGNANFHTLMKTTSTDESIH